MRKQIVGFEDYLIDTEGKVWSMKSGEMKERIPVKDNKGYLRLDLYQNGSVKFFKLHRLVALTFLDNPNNYPQVNHINGVKDDNRLENLEWCNNSQNKKHAFAIGLQKGLKGSKHSQAKITESDAFIIKKCLENGEDSKDIAEKYGYSIHIIKNIKYGRSWTHITR